MGTTRFVRSIACQDFSDLGLMHLKHPCVSLREQDAVVRKKNCVKLFSTVDEWLLVLTECWQIVCPSLTKRPGCPEMSDLFMMGRLESLGSDLTISSHLSKPELFKHWPTHLSELWLNRKKVEIKRRSHRCLWWCGERWYWEHWFENVSIGFFLLTPRPHFHSLIWLKTYLMQKGSEDSQTWSE